jgi:hypothetical protein
MAIGRLHDYIPVSIELGSNCGPNDSDANQSSRHVECGHLTTILASRGCSVMTETDEATWRKLWSHLKLRLSHAVTIVLYNTHLWKIDEFQIEQDCGGLRTSAFSISPPRFWRIRPGYNRMRLCVTKFR